MNNPPVYLKLIASEAARDLTERFIDNFFTKWVHKDDYGRKTTDEFNPLFGTLMEKAVAQIAFPLEYLLRLTPRVEIRVQKKGAQREGNLHAPYGEWKKIVVATFIPTLAWKENFLCQGQAWYEDEVPAQW